MRLTGPIQEHFQDLSILVPWSCYGYWCNLICGRPLHRRTTSLYFTPVYSSTACPPSSCHILVHHSTSSLIIADTDSQGRPNTPANDYWELQLFSRPVNDLDTNTTYITFLSNGSIDLSRTLQSDIDNANILLAPVISSLQAGTNQTLDFWRLINFAFVSRYWTVLSDLGQISPTISDATGTATTIPFNE